MTRPLIVAAIEHDVREVVENIRDIDRQELLACGIPEAEFVTSILNLTECFVGKLSARRPVAVFGCQQHARTVEFAFVADRRLPLRTWMFITPFAQRYVRRACAKYEHRRGIVSVLDRNRRAKRWLERIGFTATTTRRPTSHGDLEIWLLDK